MKIYWMIAWLSLAAAASGRQAENKALDCDCPSCREKAESGEAFTLPGLQGLEEGTVERSSLPAHDEVEKEQAGIPAPHSEAEHEHAEHEHRMECDHDHAAEGAAHDPDGDEVSGHDEHDGHDDEEHADGGIELSDEMIGKIGLQVRTAKGGTVARSSTFPAEIKLNRDRTAAVSPRFPSIIRRVFVEIGDEVKKGDVLASLENRETMAVYTVSALQDGIIISKDLAVGEAAGEDRVLYEVADLSTVWADISIFPQYQHLLQKGMPVTFVAHDGHTAKGSIKYISPIVSHETRTFTARSVLEGADEDFTPGAFVRARIVVEKTAARVVVPRDAVQTIEGESVIFTLGDQGFEARPVQTGLADDTGVEILRGLEPNDRYVASGAFALKAQMVTSGMDPHAGHGH